MASSGFGIETIVSICWESVCSAHLELLCATVFLGGWMLGKIGKKQRKSVPSKNGFKQYQNAKALPGRARAGKPSEKRGQATAGAPVCIENINPAQLKDPSWVVSEVTQLCSNHLPDALLLYRAAVEAGLQLPDLSAEVCSQLFTTLVTAAIRAGKVDEAMELLSDMRRSGLGVSSSLFASAIKLLTSKQLFQECLALFDLMTADPTFAIKDKTVWSCLLFCGMEMKEFRRCGEFFDHLKACGTPSSKDFANMLRVATLQNEWEKTLSIMKEMRETGTEIDSFLLNMAVQACVAAGKVDEANALLEQSDSGTVDVITHNTIMKGYAKARRIEDCFKLLQDMRSKGISCSQVTYGILLDCCINENQVDRAMKIVNDMTEAGCQMNTVLCTTLIKGLARAGDLQKAMKMYKLMRTDRGMSPDLITFSILIKANCDSGGIEDALKLLEDMLSLGLKPDEVVFNNLIAGCGRSGSAALGKQLYADMVKSGVRPSNATFSILIRLFHQSKVLEEAVELLSTEPMKHNVEAEPRLFLQLIQACIRERQGKRAVEVYGMFSQHTRPTATMHNNILSTCLKLNMYDTAAEIVGMAAASGTTVDECDATAVLEAAFKKGKAQVVRSMVASMKTLGYGVDEKFVQSGIENANPNKLPTNLAMRRAPWNNPGCGGRHESAHVGAAMKRVAAAC